VVVGKRTHKYTISVDTLCSANDAFNLLSKPGMSAPFAPAARTNPRIILPINNPISQSVDPSTLTIKNLTLPGHVFFPGSVTIHVVPTWNGGSTINISGVGSGSYPEINNFVGKLFFGNSAWDVAQQCAGSNAGIIPVHGG
jgi:hypothetical protein